MKKSVLTSISMFLFLSPLAYAGVVMDLVTRNASGQEIDRTRVYAQAKKIRMDEVGGKEASGSMIFLGNEFLYVDHRDKSYIVMDEAMLDEVSTQISDAMKQMEAELANMPPEQRAMVEQMMKGRMQGMLGQQGTASPEPRVEAMGSGEWRSYSCEKYAVFEGLEKTQELCAAELDEIEGAEEIVEAFRNMAAYMTKMTESLPMRSKEGMNPGELMNQINGFPVHTIDYKNGKAATETSLDAVTEQDLDGDMFAAPEGYRQQDPFGRR